MNPTLNYLKGTAGAILGAVVGAAATYALVRFGLYAGILTGAGAGWGAQLVFRGREPTMGVITAVIALVASVVVESTIFPFVADDSLVFFLRHLYEVNIIHLLMMAVGVGIAFVWGQGK
jgi:hypothetical protein